MGDTGLEQRFAQGGEEELKELIAAYGEKLLRYSTSILCDYQEAEDVVQEVFIAAHQKRASFDAGNLSAWLYKITCNKSLNKLKRSKILKFEKLGENLQSTEGKLGLSDKTLWALKQLKPKERALVYGRVMEEQSYAELSRMLGSSPETLRKQFERAKKKLAMILGGKGHNDG